MQQRPNIPGGRRPLSPRQRYEALRRRRRQNMIAIAAMALVAAVLVTAVVLILRPRAPKDVAAVTAVEATAEPVEATAEPTGAPGYSGPLRSVRLRVVGDIMMCKGNLKYAKKLKYDFHDQFSMVADLLANADYTMGNMEGTVGKYNKSAYSGYPQFNCPETVLEALKDDGIDFLTLANNHMLDRWTGGLLNTVNWVEQYGFDHVGGYRTQEEKDAPVIYEVGNIKFGFLAYTHSTNTMERTTDAEGVALVPYIHQANFKADVKKLRDAGAEVIVAWPHWGKEYVRDPDSTQKKYAKKLAEAGVDIILGSHSHIVQPMGFQTVTRDDGTVHDVFTIFSLGNFISDHVKQYCDNGVILDLTVNERADGSFTVDDVGYIPTYTWKQGGGIRVMPSGPYLQTRPSGMDDANYQRMVEGYNEIVEALGTNYRILDR